MAIIPLCARLANGQDASCITPVRRYFQQGVVINQIDIDPTSTVITKTVEDGPCDYSVAFTLKTGTSGFRFTGPQNGDAYFGSFDKTTSDFGYVEYLHKVNMLVVGATKEAKCMLEALDKGSYVVALQFTDGTVEIYGFNNGLTTADYTSSLQENGGVIPIVLQSRENNPEGDQPYVYVSGTPGQEGEDFDTEFAVA